MVLKSWCQQITISDIAFTMSTSVSFFKPRSVQGLFGNLAVGFSLYLFFCFLGTFIKKCTLSKTWQVFVYVQKTMTFHHHHHYSTSMAPFTKKDFFQQTLAISFGIIYGEAALISLYSVLISTACHTTFRGVPFCGTRCISVC